MSRSLVIMAAVAVGALAAGAPPARAELSACYSAMDAKDPHDKINLFTICLKRGRNGASVASRVFFSRALIYEQLGETENALQDYNSAVQYDSNWPDPYFRRAGIESSRGLCKESLADIERATKMAPPRAALFNSTAWVLATCADPSVRDGHKAVALAQKALRIKNDPELHDTLAAAYAETGDFEAARTEEQLAISMAGKEPDRIAEMKERLDLYGKGQPYHTMIAPTVAGRSDTVDLR